MATRNTSPSNGNAPIRSPNSSNAGQTSSKRNKPCQQCQKLKVKCERNPAGGSCQRCQSQNKECTYFDQPNKKRKKDPDEYILDVEEVDGVDALMSWKRRWLRCASQWGSIILCSLDSLRED